MDFIRHDTTRKCEVIGEKGTLIWNAVIGKVEYFSERGNAWEELFIDMPEINFTYREQIKHFISCVEKGTAPYVSGVDGTSCSSPLIAGVISILNDHQLRHNKSTFGFINPLLYKLQQDCNNCFNDII